MPLHDLFTKGQTKASSFIVFRRVKPRKSFKNICSVLLFKANAIVGNLQLNSIVPAQFCLAGRNFDRSIKTDNDAVIINQAAAELLGYKNAHDIVNLSVSNMAERGLKIIGVIKNYNQRSLKEKYEPIVFTPFWNNSAIAFWVIQTELFSNLTSIFVFPSSV